MSGVLSGLAALVAVAVTQAVHQPPQERGPDTVEDIVVTGVAPGAIEGFVDALVLGRRRGQATDQIARWTAPLCVQTIGGQPAANLAFSAQVTSAVRRFGVETREGRCRPNVVVVATRQPDAFARLFTDQYRVRHFQSRRSEYTPFLEASGPVRWGHSIEWSGAGATELDGVPGGTGSDTRTIDLPNTRLRLSTAASIRRTMIVIDQSQIEDVPQEALAAYVAFAALVELPRDVEALRQDSILNLFRKDGGAKALEATPWDIAFVQGVYASNGFVPESVQRTAIAQRMRGVLAQAGTQSDTDSPGGDR